MFVPKYLHFQPVKPEPRNPGGLINDMGVLIWKWDEINMDIVSCLPRTRSQKDSIWVIVFILAKSTHFVPLKSSYSVEDYAWIYINEIVILHGNHWRKFRMVWCWYLIFGKLWLEMLCVIPCCYNDLSFNKRWLFMLSVGIQILSLSYPYKRF